MYPEVLKFIKIIKNRTGLIGGYYQVQLPLRKDEVNLPNNASREEIFLLGEKPVKKSLIQTRLQEVYELINLEETCKRINIFCGC